MFLSRRWTIPGRRTPPIPESVHHGSLIGSHRRMDDQTCGLVNNNEVRIFIDNGKGDVLGKGSIGFRFLFPETDDISDSQSMTDLGFDIINQDIPFIHELFDL